MRKVVFAAAAGLAAGMVARTIARQSRRMDFEGRSVVITGARGLALELARCYVHEGARITLLARSQEELQGARQALSGTDAEVLPLECDVRNPRSVDEAVAAVVGRYGGVDVLVNNAGVIQVGPIELADIRDFEDAMAVHTWGPLYLMRAVTPLMKRRGGGRIVNISSIGGLVSVPHLVPYCTSKFALVGLSDGMRAELAKDNIRVTTVCPGLMRTGSHVNAFFFGQNEKEYAWFALSAANPLLSTTSRRAAKQIVDASRYGLPRLTITPQARLLHAIDTLFPSLTAAGTSLAARLLPDPEGSPEKRTGWESRSGWAPAPLTRPADKAIVPNNEVHGPKDVP